MIEFFSDWKKVTGTFYLLSVTRNSAGQPLETWTAVTGGSSVSLNYWVDSAIETNKNDKFVDQKTGTALVGVSNIAFVPTTKMRISISSKDHYITGVDNIAEFGDFYVIKWTAQVG